MDPLTILNDVRIAAPCPASWAEMKGDDRARFCGGCEKHVYNIAAMAAVEAVALIERNEGALCLRLYRRRDGTVLTADCPVGKTIAARSRLRKVAAGAVMGLTVMVAGAIYKVRVAGGSGFQWYPPPTGPGVTIADWKDWTLEMVGVLPRGRGMVAGAMVPCNIPSTNGTGAEGDGELPEQPFAEEPAAP